ncbi:toll/interleukin-1 receptor domain-containing protein, partial [Candidatus Entotheonella palauensis]|uniref:toll/interleukin-1 receptor domain-containing protein n=1 Tax=Candidatus Entotheonella palauensis TaxID=93172 RepID=UPI0015C44FBF
MSSAPPVRVFYSYAHADEALRDELEQHLSLLMRQGLIEPWYDRNIRAGSEWRLQIDTHLDEAQLILLLISPAFIHSTFCYTIELPRAMERHHHGEARVIPIYMRPVDWHGALFAGVQGLPMDAKAVTEWSHPDLAFKNIAEGLRQAAEAIQGTHPGAPMVHAPLAPKVPIFTRRMWAAGVLFIIAMAVAGGYLYTRHIKPVHRLP